MNLLTTVLAINGVAILTAAAPSAAYVAGSCGKCDTYPNGRSGGNAQIPLRLSEKQNGAYKCSTFGEEVRLSTCYNAECGLCVFFMKDECQGGVVHWSGAGSEFGGQGARSYFCM